MPTESDANPLLLSPSAVRLSIKRLISAKIHPTFAGYLCVCREARLRGKTKDLQPSFKGFFDIYLRVAGAPDEKPYLMPFTESRGAKWTPFFNRNVAGSYAPSSLREVSPFQQVVEVGGSRRQAIYSLVSDHAAKASGNLLFGKRIGAVSLAAFLYRDYGLELDSPNAEGLVSIFRDEFGFRAEIRQEDSDFGKLFNIDSSQFGSDELFIKTTLN